MSRVATALRVALLLLGLIGAPIAGAQTPSAPSGAANTIGTATTTSGPAPGQSDLDYDAWGKLADRAETAVEGGSASAIFLEQTRAQIADWRAAFLAAQKTNAARIATLRGQIDALGPAPAEGVADAPEIATRRSELTEQLVRLQAPVIAADEAYSRADGLIREIDTALREQQASALLRVWPMPVNPANWSDAATLLHQIGVSIVDEVRAALERTTVQEGLVRRLPAVIGLLLLAVALTWRGRRWFERLPNRLLQRSSGPGREVWAFIASLGQIVVPTLGVFALTNAVQLTGLAGPVTSVIAVSLTLCGFAIFSARWLGARVFPRRTDLSGRLNLTPERMKEGRLYATGFGVVLALELLHRAVVDTMRVPDAGAAVLAFPTIVLAGIGLVRVGQILRLPGKAGADEEGPSYRDRFLALVGQACIAVGIAAPVVAAMGYVSLGQGLVFPAIASLALISLIFILQRFAADIFGLVTKNPDAGRDALTPVLMGFALAVVSLPLFALIWGARMADLSEAFTRLSEGFQLGETRISPQAFFKFIIVFGIGYVLTRALQGALKSTILPKTKLDLGGRNAVVSGMGYLGVAVAALIAIDAAGIDLSGLAFVAGALSLGIGFGLQNIVQNFVSGLILLIERPVSEGDWIEVNGVQGIVQAISVRSTRIQTFDRTDVIVPNADLVSNHVTNWTRFNLTGRLILKVGVAYGTDTRKVERILHEIAEAQPLVVLNPKPLVVFQGFGADSLDFDLRMILRDVNYSLAVRSEVNHEIARRFAEEGIEIPFAQRDIWLRNPEALARLVPEPASELRTDAAPDPRLTGGPGGAGDENEDPRP